MHFKRFKVALFATLVAILASASLLGQAISGDLVGIVKDASGAGVPNASVTATNDATNTKTVATANSGGEYRINNLQVGSYTISAGAKGFTTTEVKNVAIDLNKTVTLNVSLQVGNVSTVVEVSEAATVIDTTTAQIQNTFTEKQSQDIPMTSIGNGVINLSLLQAGVASSGGTGYGAGPSIGGQRPTNNNFTIDGVDNNDKSVTGPTVFVPNDDVAEFTLLQNQFRAEYGHSSGGQFNTVVRSGSNGYHATLYEYLRNRDLNAVDQSFANKKQYTNPRYDQSRLGMNGGGPIIKNKWFFFAGFEYNPLGQASTSSATFYAPTDAGWQTLSGAAGINSNNLGVLKTYAVAPTVTAGAPNITVGGVTVPTGIIAAVGPSYQNAFYGVASSDYNISDKDQIRGRFIYNRYDTISTSAYLPAFYTGVPQRNYLASLAEYHSFNPNLVNELRLGFNRQNAFYPVGNQTFPGLDAFPNLYFADLNLQVGPNPNYPQGGIKNTYQVTDTLTFTRGKHTFKVGGEWRDYISTTHFTQRVRGDYEYSTVAMYLTDVYPDLVNQRSVGDPVFYGNDLAQYFFFQDTYRITPRLTIDAGIRYEHTGMPLGARQQSLNAIASVPGLVDFREPKSDTQGWGPRLGIAYTPTQSGNTVFRAGFSRSTDVIYDNLPLNSPPPQFTTAVNLQGVTGSNFLKNGGINSAKYSPGVLSAAQARTNTSYYLLDQVLPYSLSWTGSMERVIARDYTLEVRYTGNRGVHQLIQQQYDRLATPVNATRNIPTFLSAPSASVLASLPYTVGQLRPSAANGNVSSAGVWIDPQWIAAGFSQPITTYTPQGWSSYHGLAIQMKRRFSNGLQFLGAYTWSHNIDNSTATLNTSALSQRRVQDFGNLSAERATSALDRRNRLTLSMIYDAPWFKSKSNWLMKNIVGNWEVAPVYTYESPEYFTVYSGINGNFNGDSGSLYRTIINPAGVAGTGSTVYGLDRAGNVIQNTAATATVNTVVAWVAKNPNARYIQAAQGAFANAARNTEPSRPIDNIDMSLVKRFDITERVKFSLFAQALNLFNHPQFIPGSINDTARVNTSATTAYSDVRNVLFNNPEQAFASNARTLQITAKITF
jgi:hypothetical protein